MGGTANTPAEAATTSMRYKIKTLNQSYTAGIAALTDSSGSSHTVTAQGGATTSTSVKKFGASSISFDGTNDYLVVASHNDFLFGTNDFTIEYFAYQTIDRMSVQVSKQSSGSARWFLGDFAWNRIGFDFNNGSWIDVEDTAQRDYNDIGLNTWHHVAFSVSSSTARLYINGTKVKEEASFPSCSVAGDLWIGESKGYISENNRMQGYMDEIRISNTARYTGATLTVPTARFTTDANTKLLIHGEAGDPSGKVTRIHGTSLVWK